MAQEIGAALGISYDNSNSSLNAATVQAALDEFEKRFPVVLDKNKKVIGHMLDTSSDGLRIWAYDIQAALEVDPLTGEFIDEKRDALYFSDNNCSGKNYLEENNPGDPDQFHPPEPGQFHIQVFRFNSKYYKHTFEKTLRKEEELSAAIKSYLYDNRANGVTCRPFNSTTVNDEAALLAIRLEEMSTTWVSVEEITMPKFEGPLSLGHTE